MSASAHADPAADRAAIVAAIGTAATELRAVLERERAALDALDSAALDEATVGKSALLEKLDTLESRRRALDAAEPTARAPDAWPDIRRTLEACRHINEINGSIVAHQLSGVRRALGILRGTGQAPPVLYNPLGRAETHVARHPLSRA